MTTETPQVRKFSIFKKNQFSLQTLTFSLQNLKCSAQNLVFRTKIVLFSTPGNFFKSRQPWASTMELHAQLRKITGWRKKIQIFVRNRPKSINFFRIWAQNRFCIFSQSRYRPHFRQGPNSTNLPQGRRRRYSRWTKIIDEQHFRLIFEKYFFKTIKILSISIIF